jgi:predicted transcriptional regulator of viral defense system
MRNLSRQEYALMSELALQSRKIVTPAEAATILSTTRENAHRILSRLHGKGWLTRIERGRYLGVPMEGQAGWAEHEFVYASQLIVPYYISYRSALAHWGLTAQLLHVVFVATTRRKRNLEFQGVRFRFVTIRPHKFFGYAKVALDATPVQIASPEKTIVDCLDQEQYSGGMPEIAQALLEARERLDVARLTEYALQMRSNVLVRRLGYLLDLVDAEQTEVLAQHVGNSGYAYLSRLFPRRELARDARWRLIVNVEPAQLQREREVV